MSVTPSAIVTPRVIRARHHGFTLANGVRCVVIQDPAATSAAAAMSIRAGQLNDPAELPGLAHFCEHMLFMGTEKYPREDEYSEYLSKNNGNFNAFTANQTTNYYFTVSNSGLEGALERFTEFFVAPSFSPGSVAREVQMVHSEDERNHTVDYWRIDEIVRSLYNPKHPRSRYGNGNETTLWNEPRERGVDLRKGLLDFYGKHYLAGGACMAVHSSRDPEEVMSIIAEPLSRMAVGEPPAHSFLGPKEHFFPDGAARSWINVRTIEKYRTLRFLWPVRLSSALWRAVPSAYISHVLAHECDTSVLGVLKRRKLATGMVAGTSEVDSEHHTFRADIALTTKGFASMDQVIRLVYQGIGLAIRDGVDRAVYEQMKAEMKLSFESAEIDSASNHCCSLAMTCNTKGSLEHCWDAGEIILEDNEAESLAFARQLTPDSAVMFLLWGSLPCPDDAAAEPEVEGGDEGSEEGDATPEDAKAEDERLFNALPAFAMKAAAEKTRFHKTSYVISEVPETVIAEWRGCLAGPYDADLGLPTENPFISTDFTVFDAAQETAVVERFESPHGITCIRKDAGHHGTFMSSVVWCPISPVAYANPLHRFYVRIMRGIFTDAVTQLSYFGELASLNSRVSMDPGGVGLSVTGPYQNLPRFFSSMLDQLLCASVLEGTEEAYDAYFEKGIRDLESSHFQQPYELARDRFSKAVQYLNYTFEEILDAAKAASYGDYKRFVADYLRSGFFFECFIAGNVPSAVEMHKRISLEVEKLFAAQSIPVVDKSTIPRFRDGYSLKQSGAVAYGDALTVLDAISFPCFDKNNTNVCSMLSLFIDEVNPRTTALVNCAVKLMSSHFFNALRTKESLGYVVVCTQAISGKCHYIQFIAQSALADVDGVYLLSRVTAFLASLEGALEQLCQSDDVRNLCTALIEKWERKPESVEIDARQLAGDYTFPGGMGHRQREAEEMRRVDSEDLKRFFREYIFNHRTSGRALLFTVNSKRTEQNDPFLAPGVHTVTLPPLRAVPQIEAEEEKGLLALPDFADGAAKIQVSAAADIGAYQTTMKHVPCPTF